MGQRLGSGRSGLAGGCNLRHPNFRQVARRSFSTLRRFPNRRILHAGPITTKLRKHPARTSNRLSHNGWSILQPFRPEGRLPIRQCPSHGNSIINNKQEPLLTIASYSLPWVFLAPSSAVSTSLPAAAARPLLLPPSTLPAPMRPTSSSTEPPTLIHPSPLHPHQRPRLIRHRHHASS